MNSLDVIEQLTVRPPLFSALEPQPADGLLGLIGLYRADPRAEKLDLGVGVFRDDRGATPVMRAVKAAEARLLAGQESKAYLGPEGDEHFTRLLADRVFGGALAGSDRLSGVQTAGGTGALRLGAELVARANGDATIWVGAPTWPNHGPIFRAAGLRVRSHRFYDPARGAVDFDGMMVDLAEARPGDIILVHGCCHNPTGATLTAAQWAALADMIEDRGLVPFIDLAYQGLGDGLEDDAAATRMLLDRCPEALVAYSCDKNFGLYRDRVGAFWVQSASRQAAAVTQGNVLSLARAIWSMPPDHGAAIVRLILEDAALTADWEAELAAMRLRINGLRLALAEAHPALSAIGAQRGMFALLPVTPQAVIAMREAHGIYMAGNGRINIAGLRHDTIPAFIAGVAPHLT
ncbi:amino acid aminotransferase [Sphingobium aquiterrae]|uniref:amino acid aminotransferase n=1 Tax=Sphingobium aquiterrae TaxID=2038656 RepID=UPI003017407C